MGLGKSIQALGIASFYRDQWPLLIIVPASLRQVWSDQIFQWYHDITPDDVTIIMNAKNAAFKKTRVVIVSYELIDRIGSSEFKFGVVIVDESHSLKNPRAKRTVACKPVINAARRVIMLSGTPALSRPSELFPQLNALRPDLFRGFGNFGNRYCNPVVKGGFTSYDGCDNVEELFAVLRETVMIRRLKTNVLSELPPKKRLKIAVAVSQEQQDMIAHVTETLVTSRANEGHAKSFDQLRMVIELFNDSGRAKLPQVLDHIRGFLMQNPTEKVIVFAHHRDVLLGIESLCRGMRAGSHSSGQRLGFCAFPV
jgi:SWI/SNF-related matrix-associated actin-dependent regulator of chromatin subfamily A-like protein 1